MNNTFMPFDQNSQITLIFFTFFKKKTLISQKNFLHIKPELFWKYDVLVKFSLHPKIYKKHLVWFIIIFGYKLVLLFHFIDLNTWKEIFLNAYAISYKGIETLTVMVQLWIE